MVLEALVVVLFPVKNSITVIRIVRGEGPLINCNLSHPLPCAMGLEIRLGYHVDAVFIAQVIEVWSIRVVGGTYCVYVVPLHYEDVLKHFIFAHDPSFLLAPFMSVHAVEYESLSIEQYDTVFDFNASEPRFQYHMLYFFSTCIECGYPVFNQVGFLGRP